MIVFDEEKVRDDYRKNYKVGIKQKDIVLIDLDIFNNHNSYNLDMLAKETEKFFRKIYNNIINIIDRNDMIKNNVVINLLLIDESYNGEFCLSDIKLKIEVIERLTEEEYIDIERRKFKIQLKKYFEQEEAKKREDYVLYLKLKKRFE